MRVEIAKTIGDRGADYPAAFSGEGDLQRGRWEWNILRTAMPILDKQIHALIRRLQGAAPVNIVGIAKVLGLEVYESNELPEGIAGKIFRDRKHGGQGEYSIVVRGADNFARKRFTVSHEIAHYLLHRHLFAEGLVDDVMYRSQLSTKQEIEANTLAADLLMPWHLLRPVINRPIDELAQMFQVSKQAMNIRLESRGIYVGDSAMAQI
jgi:hypothetical protein